MRNSLKVFSLLIAVVLGISGTPTLSAEWEESREGRNPTHRVVTIPNYDEGAFEELIGSSVLSDQCLRTTAISVGIGVALLGTYGLCLMYVLAEGIVGGWGVWQM